MNINEESTKPQVYYEDAYLKELDATVTSVTPKGSQVIVELDRTIFYPEGGGQPSDQGELVGANGKFRVDQVRTSPDGRILHQGSVTGRIEPGEMVHATLKWNARHKNMRVHSAGHLVHDVLMSLASGLTPTKGNHGPKSFIEYAGHLDPAISQTLEAQVNAQVARDLPVITRETTYDELAQRCKFIPAGLPKNKQLRMMQIGDYDPMPDGGVQVKSTKEIGEIVIHNITSENNVVVVRYGVAHGSDT